MRWPVRRSRYIRAMRNLDPGPLLSYIDESGDTGFGEQRSSTTYTLGCVVINSSHWGGVLDEYVEFRRRLKNKFKIPVRAELKANFVLRGNGTLKHLNLSPAERGLIFRSHVKFVADNPYIHVFAVVATKSGRISGHELFQVSWVRLFQRLERTSEALGSSTVQLIHDQGEDESIRKLARWSRRRLSAGSQTGSGSVDRPFKNLVEDPVSRDSRASYFVQMADFAAYAAYRRLHPGSEKIQQIIPHKTWDLYGDALLTRVTNTRPGTAKAIVKLDA